MIQFTKLEAEKYRKIMNQAAEALPDSEAYYAPMLFEKWLPEKEYKADKRLDYKDKLYKVVQAHTSQADWTPDTTPALYTEVPKPGEILPWKKPQGAHDAYMTGDKVYYPNVGDKVYESTHDYNIYSPEEYPDWWAEVK